MLPRIDQGDLPGLCAFFVHFDLVGLHVKGYVRHVQEVICKVLLDQVALIAAADYEVMDPMV